MAYVDDVIERTELRDGETYFVQCMAHGLVGIARPGSALEASCERREARGLLEALPLQGPEECPECRRQKESEDNLELEFGGLLKKIDSGDSSALAALGKFCAADIQKAQAAGVDIENINVQIDP